MATLETEKTYSDMQRLVHQHASKFHRQHGGDWDEVLSACQAAFARTRRKWNPDRSKFVTYLWWQLHFALKDLRRERIEADQRRAEPFDPDRLPDTRNRFCLRRLTSEVSDDARFVLRLVMECDGRPEQRRNAACAWLREAGWVGSRILESFNEIKEALGG